MEHRRALLIGTPIYPSNTHGGVARNLPSGAGHQAKRRDRILLVPALEQKQEPNPPGKQMKETLTFQTLPVV